MAQLIDKVRNTIEMTFGEGFEQRLREAGKGTLLPGPFSSLLKKMQMGNAAASLQPPLPHYKKHISILEACYAAAARSDAAPPYPRSPRSCRLSAR